ncbi:MAG: hypothetical protein IH864_04530 [Chloroflexi bacterium]|nr:hypothetical protein [Chloroflexota bacterium]
MALALSVDPWASEYESALQLDEEPDDGAPDFPVRTDVETDEWRLMIPEFTPLPSPVAFIDGVQRVELRVLTDQEGKRVFGAFASLGVGTVFAAEGEPRLAPERPLRALAFSSGANDDPWIVDCGTTSLVFEVHSSPESGYKGVKEALGHHRLDRETRLGRRLVDEGHALIIMDGRLRFTPGRGFAVGLTKTLHYMYLVAPEVNLLKDVRPQTRTPVFAISFKDEPRYSWYTRLAEPRPIDHNLAGVVRLETMASIGIEAAVRLADLTTVHLPRFASSPIWDARAPQNLYPFAALEQRLRHELGDHAWVRRAIEAHIMGGGP